MLRITQRSEGRSTRLKLEGVLREGWLDEFSAQVDLARRADQAQSPQVQLDLADVTFVDAAGTQLLRELISQQVHVVACSGFVAASLGLEQS